MGNWSKLKADEKVRVIKFARLNGVSDMKTIRDTYNLYSSGGDLGAYNTFVETLPDNMKHTDTTKYDMYRYWELNGRPKDFEEAKRREMFHKESDGYYHASTLAEVTNSPDKHYGTLEFIKAKNHNTIGLEIGAYLKDESHPMRNKEYILDYTGDKARYRPRTYSESILPEGAYVGNIPITALYANGGNLAHKYDAELVGESLYLLKLDNTNVSNLPTIEPVPVTPDMWLTDLLLAELNHKKALYENEGLNIVSPEFDLLTLFRGFATEPLKIFKTQSNPSPKALKDNSGLIKLLKSVKGHYPDNYNYEAANQLLQKLKEEGYNLDGIDVDKLILARVENLIDANLNGRLLLHNNDGLITAHDIGKIDDLDSDIYYAMTNFIDKKEGLGNIGKIQYFKDKDGSYHIKMIRSDKPNTLVGRDLYDAIEEAAILNGVDNTIVAETLLLPEKTVYTMETWFPNKEIVSNKGSWDLLNVVTGDRTTTGGMPVWKLHKERPSNLKSLIFDPSIVDENGIMHLGEGMYHSTGGPLYPFSFEKIPFLKTPVVRYDEGGFFAKLFGKKDTPPTPEEIKADRVERFINDTWETEYSVPKGYDPTTGLFYPYKSPEGGTKTIGPGFKLRKDGSGDNTMFSAKEAARGVTREQINEKLEAQGKLLYDKVLEFLNQKGNRLPVDTINHNIMNGLMDLRFLVGALGGWDNLREAVLNGDLEGIKKESLVTFKDGNTGKIKPDTRRNELRAEKFWHYN